MNNGTTYDFNGRTALITGGTSGIGKATALAFARRGARVLVSGRDAARGQSIVAAIRAEGGVADFLHAELNDAGSTRKLAQLALDLTGHIDILVNSAGIFPFGATAETSLDTFQDVYAINVRAPFILVAEFAPKMAERGKGAIVNVSSIVGDFGMAGTALYGSSKAALNLLTKAWAAEFGPKGVRVNAVSPGPTRTEGTAGMTDSLSQLAAAAPAGHPATPDEIANAIVYLASDNASFIHGVVLPVDGGRAAV
ncbi:MAG TPA: SDR family oxidoreductase [Candidatus Baltobacteraceae bacterium]|jgi:NAD(P)-dependent dehydrogenase (short-subunit alcohol dehydrogenase family)|nr:SDR family oxidoreductase [Candidatus Baltobacteraceae bacterium]